MYSITEYDLVTNGVECKSDDESLGSKDSVEECAEACSSTIGCRFFIYTEDKSWIPGKGNCYWEKTHSSECLEGWQEDSYNFYSVKGKLDSLRGLFSIIAKEEGFLTSYITY